MTEPTSTPSRPVALTAPELFDWATTTFEAEELSVLGDERVTYREAAGRSKDLARALLSWGVVKGTRVGVLAPNGPELSVALMAVTRVGGVAVPLNTFQVPAELAWTLADADVHVLLTVDQLLSNDYLGRLEAALPELADAPAGPLHLASHPFLRHVHVFGGSDRRWASPLPRGVDDRVRHAAEARVRPSDDHLVIYTSGSTARPKGVIHTHGSLIRQSWFISRHQGWEPGDRVYMPLPYFWIGGYVYGFLGALETGATTLCELRLDPPTTLRLLEKERATVTMGWPHVGATLASHPDFPRTDLSRLKGPYHQELLVPERRVADPTLLVNPLGMTETATSHTWWDPRVPLPEHKRGSLGVTAPGWEHKVVDDGGRSVPVGGQGEICVRGLGLMRGIIGRERQEVFDPDGWYHTGDAGWLDADGHVYFAGRIGDLVKTAGANVSPLEVEAVLHEMPEVLVASVIGLPDPVLGQLVCGVIVLHSGAVLTEEELHDRCRAALSAYKVPKRWVFLDRSEVPYTASDKVDKARLVDVVLALGAPS